jgi:hypothetical protein
LPGRSGSTGSGSSSGSSARARWADLQRRREVLAWVEASCAAQGVPVPVSDRRVLGEVAELLARGRGNGSKSDA